MSYGKITPLPWEMFTEERFSGWYAIREKTDDGLNHEVGSGDGGFEKEDAEFIVRAVNSHEQLVAALKMAVNSAGFQYMAFETRDAIDAALAAAGAA